MSRIKFLLRKFFWRFQHRLFSDVVYAKYRYYLEFDRSLNLKRPKAFSEKIQYLKLYERSEQRKLVADREKVRDYVAEKIGSEHLIPVLLETETLSRSLWDQLPQQFVLKANHGSGMVKVVRDKDHEKYDEIYRLTEKWKSVDFVQFGRERIYEGLPRTILAEELLIADGYIPDDYKLFCFNGKVEVIQVDTGRFIEQYRNFYNRNLERLDVKLRWPSSDEIVLSDNIGEMIRIAEKLSEGFNFLRVDLYPVGKKIYFGELTNFPANGFAKFEPESFDFELGEKLNLGT